MKTDTRLVALAVILGWLSGLFSGIWVGMSIGRKAAEDRMHVVHPRGLE